MNTFFKKKIAGSTFEVLPEKYIHEKRKVPKYKKRHTTNYNKIDIRVGFPHNFDLQGASTVLVLYMKKTDILTMCHHSSIESILCYHRAP